MSDVPLEDPALRPTGLDPRTLAHCPHCHTGRLVIVRVAAHPASEPLAMHVDLIDGEGFEFPTDTPHEGMPIVDLYLQCLDCEQWAAIHLASGMDGTRFLYGPMAEPSGDAT
jgi:hypothetical protein